MARITVEDCLTKENNRFALVQLAAKRTKQLLSGSKVLLADQRGNKAVVTALREIAAGQVRFMTEDEKKQREEDRIRAIAQAAAEREAAALASASAVVPASSSSSDSSAGDSSSSGSTDGDASSNGTAH